MLAERELHRTLTHALRSRSTQAAEIVAGTRRSNQARERPAWEREADKRARWAQTIADNSDVTLGLGPDPHGVADGLARLPQLAAKTRVTG